MRDGWVKGGDVQDDVNEQMPNKRCVYVGVCML